MKLEETAKILSLDYFKNKMFKRLYKLYNYDEIVLMIIVLFHTILHSTMLHLKV